MQDFKPKKREIAYKMKIGDILIGTPIVEDIPATDESSTAKERFRFLDLGDKKIVRVNIVANIVDKYVSEGEKKYSTLTIDDASGQLRLKLFGEDVAKFEKFSQGDTILTIGVLRSYNQEVYLTPEIIKLQDPRYLLVRKLELEKNAPVKPAEIKTNQAVGLREQILDMIKSSQAEGINTSDMILKITSASPETINSEIIKLLEDGMIYEPRPGRVRWLG